MRALVFGLLLVTKPQSFRRAHLLRHTEAFLQSSRAPPSAAPVQPRTAGGNGAFERPAHLDEEEQRKHNEFRLNVGKVIDTVQITYPFLFSCPPDMSIYESDIELTDPSGVSLRGLAIYRQCFNLLRLMRRTLSSVEVKSKVAYSLWDPYTVRVRWNIAASTMLNPGRTYFIDGVSLYKLSDKGFVRRHVLMNIIVNGREVQQPYLLGLPILPAHGIAPAQQFLLPSRGAPDSAESTPGAGHVAPPVHLLSKNAVAPLANVKAPEREMRSNLEFCQESFDCEWPLFCCDLLFAKVCCSNGAFAPVPQPVPIPIPVDQPYPGVQDEQWRK